MHVWLAREERKGHAGELGLCEMGERVSMVVAEVVALMRVMSVCVVGV